MFPRRFKKQCIGDHRRAWIDAGKNLLTIALNHTARADFRALELVLARGDKDPVAIVDIGSNSVRLVAYQALTRALTPIFNEKAMCALGKGVVVNGRLSEDGVAKALKALRRFRALCETMQIADVTVIATAAARDAANGPDFLDAARSAIGCEIALLSGAREAELSALGVASAPYWYGYGPYAYGGNCGWVRARVWRHGFWVIRRVWHCW